MKPALTEVMLVLAICICVIASGCAKDYGATEAPARDSTENRGLLVLSNPEIDLGDVQQGGCKEFHFELTNLSEQSIEAVRLQTSCDCLEVQLPETFPPRSTTTVRGTFNLGHEPDFAGYLTLDIQGLKPSGETLFTLVLKAHAALSALPPRPTAQPSRHLFPS
jgi:hypothetical protein